VLVITVLFRIKSKTLARKKPQILCKYVKELKGGKNLVTTGFVNEQAGSCKVTWEEMTW
jgi:hypothetical protein